MATPAPTIPAVPTELRRRARLGNVLPVGIELPADTLTPVTAFLRLRATGEPAFLLESVERGERGERVARYSYLGVRPREVLRVDASAGLARLEDRLESFRPVPDPALPPFQGGAVGFLGFDCVGHFEPALSRRAATSTGELGIFGTLVAFDHLRARAFLIGNVFTDDESLAGGYARVRRELAELGARLAAPLPAAEPAPASARRPAPARAAFGRARYVAAARRVREHIARGDLFQCVLADRFRLDVPGDPFEVYRALRRINPSPYQFHLELADGSSLLGASPELLVRSGRDGRIETHPIAGTRPRGKDEAEDRRLERDLLRSAKERAEHVMLVDLGRNDLGRVCRAGSVEVTELMKVERYSHVMHLASRVTGRLRPGVTPLGALGACFPAGTLSGAPKIRAIQILSELEPFERGFYGGAVVRLGFDGALDSCIAIRSLRVRDGVGHTLAGAGIVADSRPSAEYDEVLGKSGAIRRAVAIAAAGRTS